MNRDGLRWGSTVRAAALPLLAVAWVFGSAVPAGAVPASPAVAEVKQPDGWKIRIHLRGDEFFSWHEDERGYVIKRDARDGFWKYAVPKPAAADFDVIDGATVGIVDPAARNLKQHDLPRPDVLREHRRRTWSPEPVVSAAPAPDGAGTATAPIEPPPPQIPVSGTTTVKNIVILAAFSDHWSGGTVSSSYGRTNTTEYANLFNQVGHTTDGAVGSVKDYYKEVSYSKLTVDSVVTAWVQLPNNELFYGAGTPDANRPQLAADAIAAADAAGFDFSQGDSDGDGWVDSLTIIHSGFGEEWNGNPADCVWSHQGSLSALTTVDGVKMSRYHTEPALRGAPGSTSIVRIGVICHETGHFFGLPDLYDYSNTTYGVGYWGLMGSGSWNGSDGKSPAHLCAWSKYKLGFVTPAIMHAAGTVSLPRVEDNASIHMYLDGTSNGEYFLVENRAKQGFDNATEISPGIVIYHVDDKSANNDLATWSHPAVKIEEADGDNSLGGKVVKSEPGDVWTSTSGLAGGFRDQTGDQDSNSMLYQAGQLYNRSDDSAYYSYLRLNTFSAAGATMTYMVSTLKPAVANGSSTTGNYTVNWGAATNATKYEIQEGTPVTLTTFSDGAESETAMYDNWALLGGAQRTTGGARTGSYSYLMQYYDSATGRFFSSVQGLTMRNPFTVKSNTAVTFYYKSKFSTGFGYMKVQVSKDGGGTWLTLGTVSGYQDAWTLASYDYTALNALGVNVNDQCLFRFVADFERGSGWTTWPSYGFAVDDFQIANMEMASYGNWSTLDSNVLTNSYAVSGKSSGAYAYQVQAYANSAWQGYGSVGVVTVTLNTPTNTNTATHTPTSTNTATATPSSTNTVTSTPTSTNTQTNTATNTNSRTSTPTSTNTRTNTPTNTNTVTNTPTSSNTRTSTPTSTNTRTNTPTNSNTATNTVTSTNTQTNTPTSTNTRTNTPTNTSTGTNTATNTPTSTNTTTATPTNTSTSTHTPTHTNTATHTPTASATATYTVTNTPTYTNTGTLQPTSTSTETSTPTITDTATETPTSTDTATHTPTSSSTATYTPTSSNTATSTPTASSTATHTPTETNTATATATEVGTPTETVTPSPTPTPMVASCAPAPLPGCAPAAKGRLRLIGNSGDATRRRLVWKWINGTANLAQFGDPVGGVTDFRMCVYDDGVLKMSAGMAGGGLCDGSACWATVGTSGVRYRNRAGNAEGIVRVKLKAGVGRAKVIVKGKGPALALPFPIADSSDVTVQLVQNPGSGSTCWEGKFLPPARINDSAALKFVDDLP